MTAVDKLVGGKFDEIQTLIDSNKELAKETKETIKETKELNKSLKITQSRSQNALREAIGLPWARVPTGKEAESGLPPITSYEDLVAMSRADLLAWLRLYAGDDALEATDDVLLRGITVAIGVPPVPYQLARKRARTEGD